MIVDPRVHAPERSRTTTSHLRVSRQGGWAAGLTSRAACGTALGPARSSPMAPDPGPCALGQGPDDTIYRYANRVI